MLIDIHSLSIRSLHSTPHPLHRSHRKAWVLYRAEATWRFSAKASLLTTQTLGTLGVPDICSQNADGTD